MENREKEWLIKKIGVISTSHLDDFDSKSGKFGETAISYLYSLERQRYLNQPPQPVTSRTMSIGVENEPMAVAWIRENMPEMKIKHCDVDYPEKVFVKTDWGLGCSPDVYEEDPLTGKIISIIEIKCKVGLKEVTRYFSPSIPYERKRLRAFDDHRAQLAGQLIAHPDINTIHLFAYDPQIDDDPWDTRSPLDQSRGILFSFERKEFGDYLDTLEEKVRFAASYLDSGEDLELIDEHWKEFLKFKKQ